MKSLVFQPNHSNFYNLVVLLISADRLLSFFFSRKSFFSEILMRQESKLLDQDQDFLLFLFLLYHH